MWIKNFFLTLFLVCSMYSCTSLSYYSDKSNPVVAEFGEEKLYYKDVVSRITNSKNLQDTILFINSYVEQWLKTEVKKEEALKLYDNFEKEVEQLVARYRNSLLTYRLENHYGAMIDTVIVPSEAIEFYNKNLNQYRLSSPIVKAQLLVVPANYSKKKDVSKMLYSSRSDDYKDLVSQVEKDNLALFDFGSDWVYFSEVIKYAPIRNMSYDSYLSKSNKDEISDEDYTYYLKVLEYRKSGDYMPMSFVIDEINKTIINYRRKAIYEKKVDSIINQQKIQNNIVVNQIDTLFINNIKNR